MSMRKMLCLCSLVLSMWLACNMNATNPRNLRLLYWNIQNGMWSDQGNNYDNFVAFVKEQNPDVCVWAEAKSNYRTASAGSLGEKMNEYLPSNWDELAARYGHSYVYLGGYRDDYPQVITSRYPLHNVKRIVGERPDSVVSHGCGWAVLQAGKNSVNVVTLHTWPQKWGFEIDMSRKQESIDAHEGDYYRLKELTYICNHTIAASPDAENGYWMMMGDFNAISSLDNDHYGYPRDTTAFLANDYVLQNTPYVDAIREWYGSDFQSTIISGRRIDYVYLTPALYSKVVNLKVLREGWVKNYRDPRKLSNFCHPSDHLPVLVDFRF